MNACEKKQMSKTAKKLLAVIFATAYIALLVLIFIYVGKPFIKMLGDHGKFKGWVEAHGFVGCVVYVLMTALQVFAAFIPGEPFEIAAGYAFGWKMGSLLAFVGIALGQSIVFFIIRKFGKRAVELFIPTSKLESIKFFKNSGSMFRMMFILFFIPGTPKDLLTYCVALAKIDYIPFIIITMTARLPLILSSTVSGDALSGGNYVLASVIIVLSAIIALTGAMIYSKKKSSLSAK